MTNLTLRHHRGYFFVVVPDTKIMKFKSRREAKNWCVEHYPGSPISESGEDAASAIIRGRSRKE